MAKKTTKNETPKAEAKPKFELIGPQSNRKIPKLAEEVYDVTSLGDGIKLLKDEKVTFTKEVAKSFLKDFKQFSAERKFNPSHFRYLHKCLVRGTFRWEQVNLMTAHLRGRPNDPVRINGQHTCELRMIMEGPSPKVTWQRYLCETEHDLRELYVSTDRGKMRQKSHVIAGMLVGMEGFEDIHERELRTLAAGVNMLKDPKEGTGSNTRGSLDADDLAYLLMTEFAQASRLVMNHLLAYAHKEWKHLARAATMAAMLATYDKHPEKATEFWDPVITGVGFERQKDPRNVLRNKLLVYSVGGGGMRRRTEKKTMPAEDMLRLCLHAWNLWSKKAEMGNVLTLKNRPTVR